jgi:hypothetical protein
MNKDCFNCGSTEDVLWREDKQEFYCELCIETEVEENEDEE